MTEFLYLFSFACDVVLDLGRGRQMHTQYQITRFPTICSSKSCIVFVYLNIRTLRIKLHVIMSMLFFLILDPFVMVLFCAVVLFFSKKERGQKVDDSDC